MNQEIAFIIAFESLLSQKQNITQDFFLINFENIPTRLQELKHVRFFSFTAPEKYLRAPRCSTKVTAHKEF